MKLQKIDERMLIYSPFSSILALYPCSREFSAGEKQLLALHSCAPHCAFHRGLIPSLFDCTACAFI